MTERGMPVLIVIFGVFAGWILGGFNVNSVHNQAAGNLDLPLELVQGRGPRRDDGDKAHSVGEGWSSSKMPLSHLKELRALKGKSPVLNMTPMYAADGVPNLDVLAGWLKLTAAQKSALASVLQRQAERQFAWEKDHITVEKTGVGSVRMDWRIAPPKLTREFQQSLQDEFGESLARSIWQRGCLDHFADLVGEISESGTLEISLSVQEPSQISGQSHYCDLGYRQSFGSKDDRRHMSISTSISVDTNQELRSSTPVLDRFRHLTDWDLIFQELIDQPAPPSLR